MKKSQKESKQLSIGETESPVVNESVDSMSKVEPVRKSWAGLSRGQKKNLRKKLKKARINEMILNPIESTKKSEVEEEEVDTKSKKTKLDKFCDKLGIKSILEKKLRKRKAAADPTGLVNPVSDSENEDEDEKLIKQFANDEGNQDDGVEVVVFENRSKKRKRRDQEPDLENLEDDLDSKRPKFDMKRAKHEVFKFGVAGMNQLDKTSAIVAQAINLGARPEKKRGKNYKELMDERKEQKVRLENERREMGNQRNAISKPSGHSAKKRDRNAPRGGINYQIGKYKDGVQFVNKKMLLSKK